ncbi:MAG: flagellar biosynthesis protein [Ruminiclostridium sp.]|nr:flagellar biosynthesis protein [Ruminiclostridium sp.]
MVISNYKNNIRGMGSVPSINTQRPVVQQNTGFENVLKKTIDEKDGLKFSKHAELRLQTRNINLTAAQKEKMSAAVAMAEAKGVKDSLVLMDNLAFVVNIRNKTVITAANNSELKENVFTNIDGAVIV